MIWLSYAIVIFNPITAFLMAWLVIRYEPIARLGAFARLSVAMVAISLVWQAGEHLELIQNYRPPRALAWVVFLGGVHLFVWSIFIRAMRGVHMDHLPFFANRHEKTRYAAQSESNTKTK